MGKRQHRLGHFLNGFAAAAQMARRAAEGGFAIEFIILGASIIDGALRIGLVLQHQIDTKSDEIPEELIFQRDEDKIIHERSVYKKALETGVIDEKLFNELQELYTLRNRVVHRYIISDITTEKVLKIGFRFEKAIQRVNSAVWILEDRQVRMGVGMTRSEGPTGKGSDVDEMARAKHGAEWLAHALRKGAA